jgi:hypothetical protein
MPTIYQNRCNACGHESAQYSEGGCAVLRSDGRVRILPHPGEHFGLEAEGLTFDQAWRQGRFVGWRNLLCRSCGGLYRRQRIGAPGCVGCVPLLIVSALCLVALWWLTGDLLGAAAVSGFVFFVGGFAIDFLAERWARRQARRFGRSVVDVPCPCDAKGGDPKLLVAPSAHPNGLPCPACGERALRCLSVGIS